MERRQRGRDVRHGQAAVHSEQRHGGVGGGREVDSFAHVARLVCGVGTDLGIGDDGVGVELPAAWVRDRRWRVAADQDGGKDD